MAAEATIVEMVTESLTAERMGSGNVPVLATPALLALVERAAVAALAGRLPVGQTSVGVSVELAHTAPTPLGATIRASVRLKQATERRLRFTFDVHDQAGQVAHGTCDRVIVDRSSFLQGAAARVDS